MPRWTHFILVHLTTHHVSVVQKLLSSKTTFVQSGLYSKSIKLSFGTMSIGKGRQVHQSWLRTWTSRHMNLNNSYEPHAFMIQCSTFDFNDWGPLRTLLQIRSPDIGAGTQPYMLIRWRVHNLLQVPTIPQRHVGSLEKAHNLYKVAQKATIQSNQWPGKFRSSIQTCISVVELRW